MGPSIGRPDPDELLRLTRADASGRGRLKGYLGMAAGVGKTVRMLDDARGMRSAGVDIVAGLVETHGRAETAARIADLEVIPRRKVPYRDVTIEEMDLDAVLRRRPDIVIVDELPHTNAPGSKNDKRWQDVEDILDAGISVLTACNVQHLEGVQDVVRSATGIDIRERVPDRIVREADSVVLVDLPVAELQERLRHGKIYPPEQAARALENFFRTELLVRLRELALLQTATFSGRGAPAVGRGGAGERGGAACGGGAVRAGDREAARVEGIAPRWTHEHALVRGVRAPAPHASGEHQRRTAPQAERERAARHLPRRDGDHARVRGRRRRAARLRAIRGHHGPRRRPSDAPRPRQPRGAEHRAQAAGSGAGVRYRDRRHLIRLQNGSVAFGSMSRSTALLTSDTAE